MAVISHLEREIHEQPAVLRALLDGEGDNVKAIAAAIRAFQPALTYIAARGTSDNAARYAQYIMGSELRMPVALAAPSLHTLYETPPDLSPALVVGISQSGASTDINRALADAKAQGALTVAITNNPESALAQTADHHLYVHAGPERSVAATKTYTAELAAVAMLVSALAGSGTLAAALAELPALAERTLQLAGPMTDWVQRYRYMEKLITIGRGINYCTAFEVALKAKELTYITADGYSEADFRHGPLALIAPGFPVLVVAPEGKTLPGLLEFLDLLAERGAESLVISNAEAAFKHAKYAMPIPMMPEWISPICAILPGQLFALHLAREKGYSLDTPRGITKVTITE
jgi:glucosamine--fructose-6-phosphate aminotransferase (isomerizing)